MCLRRRTDADRTSISPARLELSRVRRVLNARFGFEHRESKAMRYIGLSFLGALGALLGMLLSAVINAL